MSDISTKNILLVDDESYAAKIISVALKDKGFDVIIAESGEKAIEIINSGQIVHLILMDIIIENGIDGIETARIILQDYDIPIIFFSGYTDPEIMRRTESICSYGYVIKGGDTELLITSIRMALNLYEARLKIRQHEEALKKTEWLNRIISETVSDGIVMIDERGNILFVNERIGSIFGYASEELIGHNLTMLMPTYLKDNHSDSLNEYVKTGKRHLLTWSDICVPGLHKEGFEISLEISLGENIFQEQRVFCGIIKDVTERKRAENMLKEQERAFRMMFAGNPIPMWVYDTNNLQFLEVNDVAISHYGYSRDEFLTMTVADIRPAEDIPRLINKVSEIGNGISNTGIWRHLKRDGTIIYVEITSHSLDYMGKNARLVLANNVTERVRTEAKLQQQYSIFQGIIESTDAFVFSLDNNGHYTSFNKSHADMMKLLNDEDIEIGKNMLDYIRDDKEREIVKQNIDRALHGNFFVTEHPLSAYPGLCLEVFLNPIRSDSGKVVGAAVFARDVSERKKSENALKESEAIFRLMFAENPIPMWVYDSKTLRFLEVNDAAVKHYGYSHDEFLEMTLKNIRPSEDIKEFIEFIPKTPKNSIKSDIKRHYKKDGTIIYVETISHVLNFGGKQTRLLLADDVTEHIEFQKKLTESQQRLSLALRGAKAGVWEWNVVEKKMFWTEEIYRLIGLDPKADKPSYRSWIKSIHPEDREHSQTVIDQLFKNCDRFDLEYRIILPDGIIRWIRNVGYVEIDNIGKPQRVIGFQIDITERKQSKEKLNVQYSILKSVMESIDATIFSLDSRFCYTSFNMNHACVMKAIYGTDIEIGKNILDYMTIEDRNEAKQSIERALSGERFTKEIYSGEESHSRRYIEISHAPVKRDDKISGVVVFARDITERKKSEDTIKEQNEFLNNVINSLSHPFYVIDVDTYKIKIANSASMIPPGVDITCYEATHQLKSPCESSESQCALQEVRKTKKPVMIEHIHYDSDGEPIYAEVHAHPIFDADGNVHQVIEYSINITERKQAEFALQKLKDELEHLVAARTAEVQDLYNNAPCGYHSLDTNGTFILVNDTELRWLGYEREEFVGKKKFTDIVTERGIEQFQRVFPLVKKRGSVNNLEYDMIRKDGTIMQVLLSATVSYDSQGNFLANRATIFDISERRKAEEEIARKSEELILANAALEKAARLKDEFLASMSHELRTPLTGVISLSEAMLDEVYGKLNEKQLKTIRTIESSGQHLLDLITDILDLSKIEAGHMELQIGKSSVSDICHSALQLTKGMANKKRHKVAFSMNPTAISIDADPRRLKQMLVNLLSNAIKFTPDGGEITLEVRGEEAEHILCFTVRDNGIGIAPEMFHKLFRPFVQLDSSLSRRYSGTGLGLSLVQRMAELHGGGVMLESELGKGSCFTIRLPWMTLAQHPSASSENGISDKILNGQILSEENLSKSVILLVEDNEINIGIYSDYLHIRGYRVEVAENGREGIEKAQKLQPDLILMDIQMPDVDGLEAIQIIRSDTNSKIASIPIIALTSLAMPGDREKCINSGADEYLSKPVTLKYLIEIIEKHTNKGKKGEYV